MKTKTKIPINFPSETPDSISSNKTPKLPVGRRCHARQILCSASMMLTEREKMALHWLAEGLTAREIVRRFQAGNGTAVEITHIAGEARSLQIIATSEVAIAQETNAGPTSQPRLASTSAIATLLNENPS